MQRRLVALLVLAGLGLASPAAADPRWWWNDLRLTSTPTDSITPHIVTPGYISGGAGLNNVFVTWAEADPAQGDLDIWMTASFDGGCNWCEPTRLTDTDVDEVNPRIAVLGLPEGFWSIDVAFAQPATGRVMVAWDSAHVSYRVPQDQLCAQITAMGPLIIAGDQYARWGGVDAEGAWPDISAAGPPSFGHFHLTWQEDTLGGRVINYAHDLTARGGIGWTLDPVKTVATLGPIDVTLEHPRIAADLATDPDPLTGNITNDRSAASIVFVRQREAGPSVFGSIEGLRSVDSGATFSPSGARADAPSGPVGDSFVALPAVDVQPALDSSYNSFSTNAPATVAAAWSVEPQGGDVTLSGDERYLPTPAAPLPDWRVPGDDAVGTSRTSGDGAPSVALSRRFGTPLPEWIAWHDSRFGAREIVSRAGMLDPATAPMLDLTRYPITPVRPLDSAVSADVQLSHCVVDDATFDCVPTRAAGDARDVSLDANESITFAVWSDSRDGNREIYFKRTDEYVSSFFPTLASGCGPAGDAWVDVTFSLAASCPAPFAGEHMFRYFIYWRTNPAGPYDNAGAPIVVMHAAEPGPSVTRRIAGLVPGTSYRVIVVPEDEARNVAPPDFNPAVAPAAPPITEVSIDTPTPCVVTGPCLWRFDVTSVRPHVPARSAVYLVPPSADDIHVQGPSYFCPVVTGDLEPDANALRNGVPLVLYQVNRATDTLRLAKSAQTIRFTF